RRRTMALRSPRRRGPLDDAGGTGCDERVVAGLPRSAPHYRCRALTLVLAVLTVRIGRRLVGEGGCGDCVVAGLAAGRGPAGRGLAWLTLTALVPSTTWSSSFRGVD